MTIAPYLKQIGRGARGARGLPPDDAADLMARVLDRRVTDLEIGAFALAMRMKGETVEELSGFLEAVHERCLVLHSDRPVVLLPTYNGARKLPNLTPLLALRLAQAGVRVLLHGPLDDPQRVTTAAVWSALGLPVAASVAAVEDAWARGEPAFVRIDALCPPLARLLDVRWTVGLRNSGHTVAKMLQPCQGARALRVLNHTHPDFGLLLADWARRAGADLVLLRGTEGEPVTDVRRARPMQVWLGGEPRDDLSWRPMPDEALTPPELPSDIGAAATAAWTRRVLAGEAAAPPVLQRQVQLLCGLAAALAAPAALQPVATP